MENELVNIIYAAGIVDGEGCIRINKDRGKYYNIALMVENTNKELIEWLVNVFGGTCYYYPSRRENCKPSYVWGLHAKQAQNILERILPYLIVKKKQALLALQFQEGLFFRGPHNPLTKSELEIREYYFIEMKRLNKKGPVGETKETK